MQQLLDNKFKDWKADQPGLAPFPVYDDADVNNDDNSFSAPSLVPGRLVSPRSYRLPSVELGSCVEGQSIVRES